MKKFFSVLFVGLQCLAMEKSSAPHAEEQIVFQDQAETPLVAEAPQEKMDVAADDEIIVLWDLGGVHMNLSKTWFGFQTAINIGIGSAFSALLSGKVPSGSAFFDAMENFPVVEPAGFKRTCTDSGTRLPYVLCAYQAGLLTSDEVLKMTRETCPALRLQKYFVSQAHQEMVQKGIETIFTPKVHADNTSLLSEGIEIVREINALKKQGIKIKQVALSNWDRESFALVKARFPEEFALFDDIMISGDLGTIKPNDAAFEAVVKKHGSDKSKYIFVDDQEENIKAAIAFGIEKSLLFTRGDYYTLRKQLYAHGILPKVPEQKILTKGVKIAAGFAVAGALLVWLA